LQRRTVQKSDRNEVRYEGSDAIKRFQPSPHGLPAIGGIKGTNEAPNRIASLQSRKHGIA
jgi:hypothetical protein